MLIFYYPLFFRVVLLCAWIGDGTWFVRTASMKAAGTSVDRQAASTKQHNCQARMEVATAEVSVGMVAITQVVLGRRSNFLRQKIRRRSSIRI